MQIRSIHRFLLCLPILAGVNELGLPILFAQEPIAVITQLKPRGGKVEVRLAGKADWETAAPLQSLYPGSQLRASKDATAVVVFADGLRPITVEEKNSPVEVRPPISKEESGTAGRLKEIASLLLTKKRPETRVLMGVRGPKHRPPTLLSPRNTKILNRTPTFRWMGTAGEKSTLLVYDPSGLVWKVGDLTGTQLRYPDSAPLLKPKVEYRWALATKGLPPQRAPFFVLDAETGRAVREQLDALQGAGLPKTTLAILQATLLVGPPYELLHEARETLIAALAVDPNEPGLQLLLGEVYEKIGLKELAAEAYGEAESLAKGRR